jgi:hypothetical protein
MSRSDEEKRAVTTLRCRCVLLWLPVLIGLSVSTGWCQSSAALVSCDRDCHLDGSGAGEELPERRIKALAVQDPTHRPVTQTGIPRGSDEPWSDGLCSVDLTTGDWSALVLAECASEEIAEISPMIPARSFPVPVVRSRCPRLLRRV